MKWLHELRGCREERHRTLEPRRSAEPNRTSSIFQSQSLLVWKRHFISRWCFHGSDIHPRLWSVLRILEPQPHYSHVVNIQQNGKLWTLSVWNCSALIITAKKSSVVNNWMRILRKRIKSTVRSYVMHNEWKIFSNFYTNRRRGLF